jgi:hypothetical protein
MLLTHICWWGLALQGQRERAAKRASTYSARGEALLGHGDASNNSEDGEGLHCELEDEGMLRNEVLELRICVD